jgi:hypothetical protein
MKRLTIILILLSIVIPALQVTAQTQQKCDLTTALKLISSFKSSGDNDKDLTALLKLSSAISTANVSCGGYTVSGSKAKLVGPFELKEGLYRASIKSDGSASMTGKVLDGDCGQSESTNSAFFVLLTKGHKIAETIINSGSDCKLMVDIGLTLSQWTIVIEPLQ